MPVRVDVAVSTDAAALADVAAITFPLACPPSVAAGDIEAFIAANLSAQRFGEYLADPDRRVLTAVDEGRIIGYAMLVRGIGNDPVIAGCIEQRPAVEVSKMYVLPDWHRRGAAGELMEAGISWASAQHMRALWLGVNQNNSRAQRFYRKHGFDVTGTRTFRVGATLESDFVMVRAI
ncbi:GNAT family N-acetyltransferase [Mycolicibacterium sp.]|jgi:GNAT superfamily N-acetyltransferase|uniref:GNAT family N-acetyltransferase n=1 Tax=Mycolicibacterium sp. TaxID=2320850 RepID=UPI001A35F570|nr:GNAT family N-acetyltransferase [Mycolicibacterium sp.]MBJ7400218.1 GNAT family N-acetyltransferase [Mycolicibacterium sp.]